MCFKANQMPKPCTTVISRDDFTTLETVVTIIFGQDNHEV